MSEFRYVQHASFSPTKCVACGDHLGPFLDLEVELPVYGHLYLCASTSARPGCVRQLARLDGMVERARLTESEDTISSLNGQIRELLDAISGDKVVAMSDVVGYMKARG